MARSKCKSARRRSPSPSPKCRSKNRKSRTKKKAQGSKSCPRISSANARRAQRKTNCAKSLTRSKSVGSNKSMQKTKSKPPSVRNRRTNPKSETELAEEPDLPPNPPKSSPLPTPLISPRDPNYYRVIRLDNGFRAILVSTCGQGIEDARESLKREAAEQDCNNDGQIETSIFNRRRGKRERGNTDDTGKRKLVRGSKDYDEGNAQNLRCVDKNVQKFNDKVYEPPITEKGRWHEGSIMDAMLGFIEPIVEEGSESDREVDDGEDEEEWLTNPEPKDKKLLEYSCRRVQKDHPQATFYLTIGCGSVNDPPDLRGLATLTCGAVLHEIMLSKGIYQRWYASHPILTQTCITAEPTDVGDLGRALSLLGDKVCEIGRSRYWLTMEVDDMDKSEEGTQCFLCWSDPMNDALVQAVLASLAKESHPYRVMTHQGYPPDIWAVDTKQAMQSMIRDFMHRNYVANSMTLAVQAPVPLDILDEMVTNAFHQVPAGDPVDLGGDSEPFSNENFQKFYDVPCANSNCTDVGDGFILISWGLPATIWKDHSSKPILYIMNLVQNESPKGLVSYLKSMGWISELKMDYPDNGFHRNQFCTVLQIQITLTSEGLQNSDQVIETVFAYFHFLREVGMKRYLYREMQKLASMNFHALPHELSLGSRVSYGLCVEGLSHWLQDSQDERMILEQFLFTKFNTEEIRRVLDLLIPDTANFMLLSCSHVRREDMNLVEPIYQTRYAVRDIGELMLNWKTPGLVFSFELPAPNPFIPDNYCLDRDKDAKKVDAPVLYLSESESKIRIWYQFDPMYNHFRVYYVHFMSPESFQGPDSALALAIWCLALNEILDPILYPARTAGIQYNLQTTQYGLIVTLYSWNHKLEEVLKIIVEEIAKAGDNVDAVLFKEKKKLYLVHLSSMAKQRFSSEDIYDAITIVDHWPVSVLFTELKTLNLFDFQEFTEAFSENSTYVALLKGNVFERTAAELESVVTGIWPEMGSVSLHDFPVRMNQLPLGERALKTLCMTEFAPYFNHVTNFYQIGLATERERVLAAMASEMLLEASMKKLYALFDELLEQQKAEAEASKDGAEPINRPEDEQWTFVLPHLTTAQGILTVDIHSIGPTKFYSCDDLEQEVHCFLKDFDLCPWESDKKRFKKLKQKLKTEFLIPNNAEQFPKMEMKNDGFPQVYESEADGNWFQEYLEESYQAIKNLSFRFNENLCKAEVIDTITPSDIRQFFDDYLTDDGINYRMLSVQIIVKKLQEAQPDEAVPEAPKTVQEWRARRTKVRDCSYKDYFRMVGSVKPYDENEVLELKLLAEVDGICDEAYITDWAVFKESLYQYPDERD